MKKLKNNLGRTMISIPTVLAGLSVALLATICPLVSANQQPAHHNHLRESAEFQAINSYLTDLQPLSPEPAKVRPHLEAAISALDGVVLDNSESKQTEHAHFKVLLENNNPRVLITILRNLVAASRSCEQENSSFLMLIEQQTFDGQFLNKYVRHLLNNCWLVNLNTLGPRLDRLVGKMHANLFEILKQVPSQMTASSRRGSDKITIGITTPAPENEAATLHIINERLLRQFAIGINCYFSNKVLVSSQGERTRLKRKDEIEALTNFFQQSLVQPCQQLIERVSSIMQSLLDYRRFSMDSADLSMKLQRQSDPTLDFQLEAYRVCGIVKSRRDEIWSLLSKMR